MLSQEERLRKVLDRKSQSGIQVSRDKTRMNLQNCLHWHYLDMPWPFCNFKKSHSKAELQRILTLFNILQSEWETYCICYLISEWECFSLRILRRESFFDNWTPVVLVKWKQYTEASKKWKLWKQNRSFSGSDEKRHLFDLLNIENQ